MQIIGFFLLIFVVWFGFNNQTDARVVSAFDIHALVVVVLGSASAILVSSTAKNAWRTLVALRECVPGLAQYAKITKAIEVEREQLFSLWREGKRGQAVALAEKSSFAPIQQMLALLLARAPQVATSKTFHESQQAELIDWQPAIHNWEMLSKLGPSFGMVGTITGMIQLFRNMSSDNLNIGAAMSLALLATLYGVAFGAGLAGPVGHFLNGLLDERLGLIERLEKSVNELVARGGA
jgi:flagellar motor component MotA